jgi:hypothetical protein
MEDIIAGICVNFITEVINFFSGSKALRKRRGALQAKQKSTGQSYKSI